MPPKIKGMPPKISYFQWLFLIFNDIFLLKIRNFLFLVGFFAAKNKKILIFHYSQGTREGYRFDLNTN
jgi:hypothetical protein